MKVGAEKTGSGVYSGKGDARVTKVGRIIRATSIDELPQLVNILKGDMSIIGPRPEVRHFVDCYNDEQMATLLVKPGISCSSSIAFANEGDLLSKSDNPDEFYVKAQYPLPDSEVYENAGARE